MKKSLLQTKRLKKIITNPFVSDIYIMASRSLDVYKIYYDDDLQLRGNGFNNIICNVQLSCARHISCN